MKDVGEVQCIIGIKVLKDHMNRKIVLSQATYIDKLIFKYVMLYTRLEIFFIIGMMSRY